MHPFETNRKEEQEAGEAQSRLREAFSKLRGGPVSQAFWQVSVIFEKPEVLATLPSDQRKALIEVHRVLEDAPEIKALRLLAGGAGIEGPIWPERGKTI